MRSLSYLFLGAALINAACSTVIKFKSTDVTVRIENGYYKADVTYKYDDSKGGKSYLRYDYSDPISMIEVIDYNEGTRSKVCGSTCEAGFYPYGAPALIQQDGDIATGEVDGECYEYTPSVNYAVTSIWYKKDKTLCRATLADGKTLVFNNGFSTNIDESVFKLEGTSCPAPVCKRVMDLVFVIDNSGSVSSSDWEKAKSFILDVANSFDIGTDATMIGVVAYGKSARVIIELSGNKNSITTAVSGAKYVGGCTCTGCGMDLGMKFLNSTSSTRNALNPEKMMIVITDGENNELDYYQFCRKYTSTCTARDMTKCIKYECLGASHEANGPICNTYKNTTTCLKKVCSNCRSKGKCLRYGTTCIRKSTTNCARRSTTYCNGNPSSYCCRYSSGTLTNYARCGKCECTEYKCEEYACEEYNCLVYDCNDCVTYSNECLIYKQDCVEYQKVKVCDVPEECTEYECTDAKLECAEWGLGANSLLAGAVSRTRTPWALMPASKRLPIVIAIGVSGANEYELKGIASYVEGKQHIYTVNDFSELKTIINSLVDETCTKQTSNLENCNDGCKGFCGCNKKCYCPTCDTPTGSCYSISCRSDGITSTGCVATHETCPNTDKCITKRPDNNTEGCCVTQPVNCVKDNDKCKIYGCDSETGCTVADVVCTPSSVCFTSTCDPAKGCVETTVCDTSDKCKVMSCSVENGQPKCTYTDKCTSNDPCQVPVCDSETGACSLKPLCNTTNLCNKISCYMGQCIEEEDITKKIECASQAPPCKEGYCNSTTGLCEYRDIDPPVAGCENCGQNTSLECENMTDECSAFTCAAGEDDGSDYPTKCVETNICTSDNPCIVRECKNGKCVSSSPCSPRDACEIVKCVVDSEGTQKYRCEFTSLVPEGDACWAYECNGTTGEVTKKTLCPEFKCGTFNNKCVDNDGKPDCGYDLVECESDECTNAYCDNKTGECVYEDTSSRCIGDDPCVVYGCDPKKGCYATPIICDDSDPCTIDTCYPANETLLESLEHSTYKINGSHACVYTQKCPQRRFCENAYCDSDGNCSYSDYACDGPNDTVAKDKCHTVKCSDEANACVLVVLPSSELDICGSCISDLEGSEYEKAGTACVAGMKLPEFAATIGGAAVAGIVVAAVIVVAALGISSTIGTKELIKRAKKNADAGTNSNPLYEGNDNEAVNPAFVDKN